MNKQTEALQMQLGDIIDGMRTKAINNVTIKSSTLERFADELNQFEIELHKALAQPAQEPDGWYMLSHDDEVESYFTVEKPTREQKISHEALAMYYHPAQENEASSLQEPVAWMYQTEDENYKTNTLSVGYEPTFNGKIIPLYTHPASQPAQDHFAGAGKMVEQPSQEPFGYFTALPFGWTDCGKDDEGAIALYEHPAPEQNKSVKQWQGLSDDEIEDLCHKYWDSAKGYSISDIIDMAEQALKEKNYGV